MQTIETDVKASDSSGKILIRASGDEVGLLVAKNEKIVGAIWMTKEDWNKIMGKLHSVL